MAGHVWIVDVCIRIVLVIEAILLFCATRTGGAMIYCC